jgi:hypothetical protein
MVMVDQGKADNCYNTVSVVLEVAVVTHQLKWGNRERDEALDSQKKRLDLTSG